MDIEEIINDIAELPDNNSPEDWHEAMLVTAEELAMIIERHCSGAVDDIAAERQRQIDKEGWTPEHDDQHGAGELAIAAALYAAAPVDLRTVERCDCGAVESVGDPWPWWNATDVSGGRGEFPIHGHERAWDKREEHDERRRLVIAGALIVAEIERLDRAASLEGNSDEQG